MKTTKLLIVLIITSLFSSTVMPKGLTKNEVVANNIRSISKMIQVIQPNLNASKRNQLASSLYFTSKKYNVDPKIMIAIISTESSFRNDVVSTTGDLSLAQINTAVWDKEFKRLGMEELNPQMLKKDEKYALNKMGKILSILKTRHEKKDRKWYARYHSRTKKYKEIYDGKVQVRLRMIASVAHNF